MRNQATIAGNDTRIQLAPDMGLTIWQDPNGSHVVAQWVRGQNMWTLRLTPALTAAVIAALQKKRSPQ